MARGALSMARVLFINSAVRIFVLMEGGPACYQLSRGAIAFGLVLEPQPSSLGYIYYVYAPIPLIGV